MQWAISNAIVLLELSKSRLTVLNHNRWHAAATDDDDDDDDGDDVMRMRMIHLFQLETKEIA